LQWTKNTEYKIKNISKTDQRQIKDRSKTDQRQIKDRSKTDQRQIKDRSKNKFLNFQNELLKKRIVNKKMGGEIQK